LPEKEKNKSTMLNIRISPQVKELLEKSADKLGMNASEYVRFLIIEDARKSLDTPSE